MELFRALAVLAEPPRAETTRLADLLELGRAPTPHEYTELFLFQLYPYASVYLGPEGMLGGEARDRVAGFWRALGEVPPTEPDHLAVLLALYARLADAERGEPDPTRRSACRRARAALLWEHLLSWLPVYLSKLIEIAPPPYASWGRLLDGTLAAEAKSIPPPARLPLQLREAPALSNPRIDDLDTYLSELLAPVRSGVIVTRADLARAARALALGLRTGERRFVLQSLVNQDARGMIDWLGREVTAWGERHAAWEDYLGGISRFWAQRAQHTADTLQTLCREESGSRAVG
ncbi:MAG: molecular chaperone TorD family protein [Gemmatimonadales bacterium]